MTCQDDDLLCVSSIIDISPNQGHLQIQVGGGGGGGGELHSIQSIF